MFFRRMFARKDSNNDDGDAGDDIADSNNNSHSSSNGHSNGHRSNGNSDYELQRRRNEFRKYGPATAPAGTSTGAKHCSSASTLHRASTSGPAVVQLTPLWEHILRTRTLPDSVCPAKMFNEFLERLRDPEWQVRQHALRVFVDVLVVMSAKADAFMDPLVSQLVENLGHPAPTVRKGALDCLRVYLAETAMPETILLQILDIGLNQKITNEPFGGRLTCGVMLSLPALVQATLHTPKRHYILRSAIDMMVHKMGQVTHQEITLKVLSKIRELIGESEFREYMSHEAYREFELLCNVYGVSSKPEPKSAGNGAYNNLNSTWRLLSQQSSQSCWRSSEEEQMLEGVSNAKVIMEADIKFNDDTLTMRILEAKDEDCLDEVAESEDSSPRKSMDSCPNSFDDEVVCGRLQSAKEAADSKGVIRLLSDSDAEEDTSPDRGATNAQYFTITPSTPSRTPKRVTFGGEVVKMRTPDSDANNLSGNNSDSTMSVASNQSLLTPVNNQSAVDAGGGAVGGLLSDSNDTSNDNGNGNTATEKAFIAVITTPSTSSTSSPVGDSKIGELSVEIPNDNTKPLPVARPKTAQSPIRVQPQAQPQQQTQPQDQAKSQETPHEESPATSTYTISPHSPHSPLKRRESTASISPRSPFRRISVSPVDSIISPKVPHKEIEVLHNLQRDPSPVRARSARTAKEQNAVDDERQQELLTPRTMTTTPPPPPPPKSWEDLGIVDYDTLLDLRSGNWRHRLQGIGQLEEALRSPENLALVQPCLGTLLRTLLSSERHIEVAEEKRRLLINLISRLPLDNLEDRAVQIITGLCRQGGAGANRVCKTLMHRLPAATIVLKLLSQEFLHAKSSRFREHALQMVMFALMTFPSTCFDTSTCVTYATYAALNRKRRVRQAALDVLAILGQMTSIRSVLEAVQSVAADRDEGTALVSAVRARLARKQLPLVTADGLVQYTLRVPPPHREGDANALHGHMGPDIEWISAGVGSVSPSSMKRRAQRINQSFRCLPPHQMGGGDTETLEGERGSAHSSSNHSDDNGMNGTHRHSYCSPPEMYGNIKDSLHGNQTGDDIHSYNVQHILGNSVPYHYAQSTKKTNADYSASFLNRRMVAKSCSDSSMDGRSSDSTYTSSSGGGGGSTGAAVAAAVADQSGCNGISGRFTRQTVNSRFPTMDRLDLNPTYLRVHKPPTYYPGMGAYAHLQQQQINMSSTYPKINYSLTTQQRRRSQPQHQPLHYGNCNSNSNNSSYNHSNNGQLRAQQQQQQKANSQQQEHFKRNGDVNDSNNNNNSNNDNDENLDGTYTICTGVPPAATTGKNAVPAPATNMKNNHQTATNARRFVNVEKFVQPTSQKSAQPNTAATPAILTPSATPVSLNSASYSQKSTASAQSHNSAASHAAHEPSTVADANDNRSTPNASNMGTVQGIDTEGNEACHSTPAKSSTKSMPPADLSEYTDMVDNVVETALKKNASLVSLQSKTDSIKTQLEDTPPQPLSRTQSAKSLPIDEDIDDHSGSFVLVEEEVEERRANTEEEISSRESSPLPTAFARQPSSPVERIGDGKSPTPTAAATGSATSVKPLSRRNSLVKSMESLYERPPSKQDSLDNTTTSTDSNSQLSAQCHTASTVLPIKPQHTPLKQKSKTTHLLKSNRRVSPVKQSIKMQQAELYPHTMQRFEKPREALTKAFDQLDSSNWEIIIMGLKNMVRLMRYHPEQLDNQMHMVCIQLTRSVRNLRSQVARAACQAATEMFTLKSKYLEQECEDLVCALLHRTADMNRFLRADATRAVESMCDNLTPPKVLNILTSKGAGHLNALVRTTTAKLLNRLVERLGYDKVFTMPRENRDKFFVTGANLLLEGSLETRCYAKSLFRQLSNHPSYHRLLTEIIPARTYRNVEKTLKSIR